MQWKCNILMIWEKYNINLSKQGVTISVSRTPSAGRTPSARSVALPVPFALPVPVALSVLTDLDYFWPVLEFIILAHQCNQLMYYSMQSTDALHQCNRLMHCINAKSSDALHQCNRLMHIASMQSTDALHQFIICLQSSSLPDHQLLHQCQITWFPIDSPYHSKFQTRETTCLEMFPPCNVSEWISFLIKELHLFESELVALGKAPLRKSPTNLLATETPTLDSRHRTMAALHRAGLIPPDDYTRLMR